MRFEKLSVCPNAILPTRSTLNSAGYDFSALSDTLIPPYQIALIPTGVKC
jgi:dUTPase